MHTLANEDRPVDTVTVEPGSETKFYFIPITNLQKGTNFRDVWLHLKKVVKRLEHIEIYPDSTEGWICVHRHDTLRQPVHVQATGTSSIITPSEGNNNQKITIRLPISCSDHVAAVIDNATKPTGSCAGRKPVISDTETQASDSKESHGRSDIVIAHGTYKPGIGHGSPSVVGSDASQTSQSTCGTDWPVYQPSPASLPSCWYGCCYQPFPEAEYFNHEWCSPSTTLFYYTQPAGPFSPLAPTKPSMERSYPVLLSNFQWNTTVSQVENLVKWVARRCRLRDRRIRIIDGHTVIARTKGDGRKLRDGLNGQMLNGVPIKAERARRQPPGFAANWDDWIWG
ncbi:hypothetical protein F4823DRAFT_629659 [Ustulina deusta]|nr:hypothetical protein F4823DRAFT_629659 [Ustulina deusta]